MKTLSLAFLLAIFTSVIFFFTQKNNVKNEESPEFPSDWFFRQRAYPYNSINQTVYLQEMKKAKKQRNRYQNKASVWEFIGPTNIEGRITDVEILPGSSQTLFTGTASGGVFRSYNSGNNWEPVFDNEISLSIGDVAISKSNPDIIYVGTGEANAGGGSLAYDGAGIFKSTDGGNSWEQKGLEDCGSVGRMVVHPQNPDIVYVAAMGRLFSNGSQGGVYKTTDGGETWEQKLFISDSTGAIDIVVNPIHPDTVFAAMWERVRRPNRRSYGGITSGIYRSFDGGETWQELTYGLPSSAEDKGRIGIDICESNPNVLYAVYADRTGYLKGVYKSTDNGDSWTYKGNGLYSDTFQSYGWWFGRIKVDPADENTAYVIGFNLYKTSNGGNSWNQVTNWSVHVDQHALAIDPQNHNHLFLGNDGGFYKSFNQGNSWNRNPSLPITQFYACDVAEQYPQSIYGGAQDNGTVRTMNGGSDNWENIYGGDGLRVLVDPENNNYVYAQSQYGNLARSTNAGNSFTGATSGISYSDRFNWNCPITYDPQNTAVLYFGTNKLYKSTNHAGYWNAVSGDLTNGDEPGNLAYNTLTAISVSPFNGNLIYTGSDDGNVFYTADGGASWNNISGNLPDRWVTSIKADPFDESRVYVTFSGYRWDDYLPHVFRSDNMGNSWTDISSNLPEVPVNEIIIDPQDTGYLYLATDAGVYFSENGGENWFPAGSGMPVTVVDDIRLHNPTRTLYAATYGRGIYSLDLDILTGIQENTVKNKIDIKCFPNPFTEYVNISLSNIEGYQKIYISDLSGRIISILNTKSSNNGELLKWYPGSDVSKGIYFVTIKTTRGSSTSKVIFLKE